MMRKLEKKEIDLTNKGLKRNQEEIKELKESLERLNKFKEFRDLKRKYEDETRPYNRRVEDQELDAKVKMITADIQMKEEIILNLKKQLKEGVEVKKPLGV